MINDKIKIISPNELVINTCNRVKLTYTLIIYLGIFSTIVIFCVKHSTGFNVYGITALIFTWWYILIYF